MQRRFLTLKKGYTPETPIFTTISRNNPRNIILEQLLVFFFCLFVLFYRDLSSNNILDLDAGVFSNLTNLQKL